MSAKKNYRELGRIAAEQTTHEASGGGPRRRREFLRTRFIVPRLGHRTVIEPLPTYVSPLFGLNLHRMYLSAGFHLSRQAFRTVRKA